MNKIVICDTDALIALFSKNDTHNKKAKATLEWLSKNKYSIYFPTTVLAESITTAQRKIESEILVKTIIKKMENGDFFMIPVDQTIMSISTLLFDTKGSNNNTFFDAIVAATAKVCETKAIFSFDNWYKKQGFTLASELMTA